MQKEVRLTAALKAAFFIPSIFVNFMKNIFFKLGVGVLVLALNACQTVNQAINRTEKSNLVTPLHNQTQQARCNC